MNQLDEIRNIQSNIQKGQIATVVIGLVVFAFGMYAFHLSIKANKLNIKKLNDEGYK